jgi:hypothetical protein
VLLDRFLRQKLGVVERTNNEVIIRAKPHYAVGALFGAFCLLPVALGLTDERKALPGVLVVFLIFAGLAFYVLTERTIAVNRNSSDVRLDRRFWYMNYGRSYPAQQISAFEVRESVKGNWIVMKLACGRRKTVTSAGFEQLNRHVAALNFMLSQAKNRSKVS